MMAIVVLFLGLPRCGGPERVLAYSPFIVFVSYPDRANLEAAKANLRTAARPSY
jgi:hypothetical protein